MGLRIVKIPYQAPQVYSYCETLVGGGGYVCAAVRNIQAGVPPENIVALFETARGMRLG